LWIGEIHQPAVSQIPDFQPLEATPRQVGREGLQQAGAVAGAVGAALLVFDEVGADEPVAQDEGLVGDGG